MPAATDPLYEPLAASGGRSTAARLDGPLYVFFLLGFLFVGGGFVLLTGGGDLRAEPEAGAGSLVSQLILAGFYSGAGLLLAASGPRAARLITVTWPLLLAPCLALASVAWAPEAALALRRAVAYAGTIVFGLCLAWAYAPRDAATLVCRGLTAAVLISVGFAFVLPAYGVHQASDAVQAVHAGAWRGVFAHRNTLGLWAAAAFVVQFAVGRESFAGFIRWIGAMLLSAICLVMTGSSAGLALAVLGCCFYVALAYAARRTPLERLVAGVFALLAGLLILAFLDEIMATVLRTLGRDANLTGRTIIWRFVIQSIDGPARILGLGYFSGMLDLGERLTLATGVRFVNTHNGYLETFVYLGAVGLATVLISMIWLVVRALHVAFGAPGAGAARVLPALIVFLALVHNFVESTLILPNNLNSMGLAISAGMIARFAARGAASRNPSPR